MPDLMKGGGVGVELCIYIYSNYQAIDWSSARFCLNWLNMHLIHLFPDTK